MQDEAIPWSQFLPRMPRLVHDALARPDPAPAILQELQRLRRAQEQNTHLLRAAAFALGALAFMFAWYFAGLPFP
jgi:ubiquinone biosynthesis protein